MLSTEKKVLLVKSCILSGVFIVSAALLVTVVILSGKPYIQQLKTDVQKTLDAYSSETFVVSDYIDTDTTYSNLPVHLIRSSGCVIYSLENRNDRASRCYAIIIRIQTIAGPQPAVFVLSEGKNSVAFAGYAIDNGKAESVLSADHLKGTLRYWENRILRLCGDSI